MSNDTLQDIPQANPSDRGLTTLAREIGTCLAVTQSLGQQGVPLQSTPTDSRQAIECYEKNLEFAQKTGDRARQGYALHNLGATYYAMGNYAKAIDYYQQRLAFAESIKDALGQLASLVGLADAYGALGNYNRAIQYYQKSLEIARANKASDREMTTLSNLGTIYYAQKNYAKAIESQEQSLAIARTLQNRRGERMALSSLGLAYYATLDYNKAIEYQEKSLAIARELNDRLGEGRSLEYLGNAYFAKKDYAKAIECQRQSLAIAKAMGDRHAEARSLSNLGDALNKANQPKEAIATLLAAIEIWESLREKLGSNDLNKISIFETQETTYSTLQEILVKENQLETALEVTERGRSRAFVELLAKGLSSQTAQPTIAPPNIQQIQQIAKAHNSTLVSYTLAKQVVEAGGKRSLQDSELYIWVVQPTGEIAFRQSDLKPLLETNTSLASLVSEARCFTPICTIRKRANTQNGMQNPGKNYQTNIDVKLQQLHQLLVEPIADLLPANPEARVTFIPHQSLFLVPFAALQDAEGSYLIEKHTILTAPSIQVLDLTRQQLNKRATQQGDNSQSALIVGNPTMPSIAWQPGEPPNKLSQLPHSEEEALAIAKMLNATAITGASATKATVMQLMSKARFVHLATHGLLDDFQGVGIPGAIALAPTPDDNGLLTSSEILSLNLNANLVVLSACNTGRGRITGDGVIGLSRSFINAGTPSVIVSLWAVPDKSTSTLMTEFYRQLQLTSDKARALRNAQLATLKQYSNPVDWAAFTLIGEAE